MHVTFVDIMDENDIPKVKARELGYIQADGGSWRLSFNTPTLARQFADSLYATADQADAEQLNEMQKQADEPHE